MERNSKEAKKVGNYVLLHGIDLSTDTWNKLAKSNDFPPGGFLGGKIWDSIIPALEAHNYGVFAPTLKDVHKTNLSGHIDQICTLLTENDIKSIILVGHSYGGMIITGVAAKIPERISRLVYLDAALPENGQSLFDVISATGHDPLSFTALEPAAAFLEKLYFNPQIIQNLPKVYILCTKSNFIAITSFAKQKIANNNKNWTYIEIPSSHVPQASMPEEFTKILLEIDTK